MENAQKMKLQQLIAQRTENVQTIRQFDELFSKFSRVVLPDIVSEINYELHRGGTDDTFKLLFDDPYINRSSRFYVQVQLYVGSYNRDYFLNNTKNNPGIVFEGNEFNAKVTITSKGLNEEKFKLLKELPVKQITQEEISSILISFLESVYKK